MLFTNLALRDETFDGMNVAEKTLGYNLLLILPHNEGISLSSVIGIHTSYAIHLSLMLLFLFRLESFFWDNFKLLEMILIGY